MSAAERAKEAKAEASGTTAAVVEAAGDTVTSEERRQHISRIEKMRKILDAQPKERVRLPKTKNNIPHVVAINGCRYEIMGGVSVEVPRSVFEVLEQAGRI